MPPLSRRQKDTRTRMRRLDSSFWQKKLNHEHISPGSSDEEDGGGIRNVKRKGGGLFAVRREGPDANEFALEKLWAKRWINEDVFYLIQWEGYRELTWEPVANIPWQAVAEFERENIDSVWIYQSTRGRRDKMKAERPTRHSPRLHT
ncbi:hypothetical protein DVH05_023694 [Phytophthora capsici]|nr:hypothetical protein DVH05_023694 [Phytophthora capsici]